MSIPTSDDVPTSNDGQTPAVKLGPWYDPEVVQLIDRLVSQCGGVSGTLEADLVSQTITTALKLLEGHDLGQLKLISRALKEMRSAFRIFKKYPNVRRVSIFGSARTPSQHSDYIAARAFSAIMAEYGWFCITGGAHGIMKAGLEGQKLDARFGLSIQLPFEKVINDLLEGDPKAMTFRYFFTRKLMFMSHADALVAFPGGVGTQDELFEGLTLMQTGKSAIVPIILMEGVDGDYWGRWYDFMRNGLLAKGMISDCDFNFFHIAHSVEEGVEHIMRFYRRYHSSRYVGDLLVIRLQSVLTEEQIALLTKQFAVLIANGSMRLCSALPEEGQDYRDLPRLVFHHTRRDFGMLRALIDQINLF
jgi:uncharacterized protein (TIGR00730 family)